MSAILTKYFRGLKNSLGQGRISLPFSHNPLLFTRPPNRAVNLRLHIWDLTLGSTAQPKRTFTSEANIVQPPIGIGSFRKLIEYRDSQGKPYLFVDKSLFIKEILDDATEVKLITRPRRFGKTLNMSMLHHFFANQVDGISTKELFKDLKIAHNREYLEKHQGKYPVINLTFKDMKCTSFTEAYADFVELIRKAYLEHENQVLSSTTLGNRDRKDYELFLDRKASHSLIKSSLKNLTFCLSQCYGVKPIVLIDEYDTPIQTAYVERYYDEMVTFMKEFLSAGLKDNRYLENAVLTGILRVSKESIFSGPNNIKTYSMLHSRYGEYFGFTEPEVIDLVEKSNLNNNISEIRDWYNGYQAGDTIIYNPWSIVNYIKEQGKLSPYWVNTSDNTLIRNLVIESSMTFKTQFEYLLQGNTIDKFIDENIVFSSLEVNESALWTLLVMSGYLKIKSIKEKNQDQGALCQLEIPNREVRDLYRKFISEWLSGVNDATIFNHFLNGLLHGNMDNFKEMLQKIMLQTVSVYDIKGKEPEKFFHGFMLGLVASIDPTQYHIHSNKEMGHGRFDITIIPRDPSKLGIIIEVKSTEDSDQKSLEESARKALQQIDKQHYSAALLQHHVKNCLKIGVAFSGKDLAVDHKAEKLIPKATLEKNGHKKNER